MGYSRSEKMVKRTLNGWLEESLLDCKVTLFGGRNLDYFLNAISIKDCLMDSSILNYFDFKFLNDSQSVAELGFYTVANKYELSERIKKLSKESGFGFAYNIKRMEDP
jgi:hypothetical protein